MFKAINLKRLAVCIAIPLGVGFLSYLFTKGSMNIYEEINNPPLSPPSYLFPIVWSVLYILMGISLYRVQSENNGDSTCCKCLTLFGTQLAFNLLWSVWFFNLRWFVFSALWLAAMIILIFCVIVCFKKIDKTAAYLMIPYIMWCAFALYLNIGVAVLN